MSASYAGFQTLDPDMALERLKGQSKEDEAQDMALILFLTLTRL